MARTLLEFNADMVQDSVPSFVRRHQEPKARRALWGKILPATFLILVTSGLSQAQQIDPPPVDPPSAATADPPSGATATSAFQLPADQSKLSLTGCGAPGTSPRTEIEFQDQHHNLWYRATNKGLHLTSGRELHVIGGLLPTWNLAAQAGIGGWHGSREHGYSDGMDAPESPAWQLAVSAGQDPHRVDSVAERILSNALNGTR